jgi:UDP-N-acetylglucosamine acyltransferase
MSVHSTAIVDPKASIADSAEIGPYSIVGADVVIGENTVIGPMLFSRDLHLLVVITRFFSFQLLVKIRLILNIKVKQRV